MESANFANLGVDEFNESELVRWPLLDGRDRAAVLRVLQSNVLVNGTEARNLEQEWAAYVGASDCVAVSSCTHAIHLALLALGIGIGDEVIVPALTFSGTVNPVVNAGATPVFADILPATYEIDPGDAAAKRTERTKAVIPVHLHGMPCDIIKVADALPGIPIIEDACQAQGAIICGKKAGTLGAVGCFSLNQVKPLPAGQGGLIVTNDPDLARHIRALASHGQHGVIGWSYGITEFAAALARSQLGRLDQNNELGRQNARRFAEGMREFAPLLPSILEDRVPVWHKYRVMLPEGFERDATLSALRERGVQVEIWPEAAVPDLDAYVMAHGSVRCEIARHVARHSVIVGTEAFPLAAQRPETIDRWTAAFCHVFEA